MKELLIVRSDDSGKYVYVANVCMYIVNLIPLKASVINKMLNKNTYGAKKARPIRISSYLTMGT